MKEKEITQTKETHVYNISQVQHLHQYGYFIQVQGVKVSSNVVLPNSPASDVTVSIDDEANSRYFLYEYITTIHMLKDNHNGRNAIIWTSNNYMCGVVHIYLVWFGLVSFYVKLVAHQCFTIISGPYPWRPF